MTITSVVLRRRVDDLESATAFYERLTGEAASRFRFAGLELAAVGSLLPFSGPAEVAGRSARAAAALSVVDLDAAVAEYATLGAGVIAAPESTPNGRRAVVRHPDGGVFEYVGK
ncbi:VOC family protein [Streptantibioticus ferralitis]|uniref:VOC family protein n=1 Tax=Streptantibioticus ferralitis TaxID=236510 RepID=A0ABT5Z8R1_9ACTN|nr:VOC family protein [Streptantibioticus ferralitis]MDF2260212.1 VOC family protein [Streptantibioticus ferralitis]